MSELTILHQDDNFIAIDKPSGLLVHRSEIDRTETRFALQMLRDQIGRHVYPLHRLDKPTSGVLLFALSPEAASLMQPVFQEGQISKTYQALLRGYAPEAGEIDYALSDKREKEEKRRASDIRPPQPAVTHFRRLAEVELDYPVGRFATARYSLVEASPVTGRKHQIRRHMHHISHPIVGDTRYGDGRHNRLFRDRMDSHRLLLWASRLSFTDPFSGQPLDIRAPLPAEVIPLFQRFNWPLSFE